MTRVARVFSNVLNIPVDQVSDSTSPENTPQWDSMAAMNLALALEDEFDVRLSTKEIVSMRTVAIVRRVLNAKGVQNA